MAERIRANPSWTLPPVRLSLDELYEIETFLGESGLEVTLEAGDFRYDSVEDLSRSARKLALKKMVVRARGLHGEFWNYIQVSIEPGQVEVLGNANLPGQSAWIADYLRSRIPWHARIGTGPASFLVLLCVALIAYLAGTYVIAVDVADTNPRDILLVAWALVCVLWIAASDRALIGGSRVILQSAPHDMTFWERHREQFAVKAIEYLIGAVIGAVFGFVLGRVTK